MTQSLEICEPPYVKILERFDLTFLRQDTMIEQLNQIHKAYTLITANPCEAVFKSPNFHLTIQYSHLADALRKTKLYACYEFMNASERFLLLVEHNREKIKFASPILMDLFAHSILVEQPIHEILGNSLDISQNITYSHVHFTNSDYLPYLLADISVYPLDLWGVPASILELHPKNSRWGICLP